MIGDAYNLVSSKVEEIDAIITQLYGDRVAKIYQKKYNQLFACLEPIKHDQEQQYIQCLKKYEKKDLNIQLALENSKQQLYQCVNKAYEIAQKPQGFQGDSKAGKFDFMQEVNTCSKMFEGEIMANVERQVKLAEAEGV